MVLAHLVQRPQSRKCEGILGGRGGNAQFDETQALVSDQNTVAVSIRGEEIAGMCGTVEFSEVFSII